MEATRTIIVCLPLLALIAGLAAPAGACNVPVFQYALENWEPDAYGVVIFHRGPIDKDSKAVVDFLGHAADGATAPANVSTRAIDVDKPMSPGIEKIWKAQANPKLPCMLVLPPIRYGMDPTKGIRSGPPTMAAAEALIDSPVRRKVARALLDGDAGVWVLLESGDTKADDAAAKLLGKELRRAADLVELPPQDPYDLDYADPYDSPTPDDTQPAAPAEAEPPAKPSFSMVRLSRSDPAEGDFITMLLTSEPGLAEEKPVRPMALPMFGQGRVLTALIGKGINTDNILEICQFLVGPCSCTVKEQNPGADMLFAVDWASAVTEGSFADIAVPELTALPGAAPETVSPAVAVATPAPSGGPLRIAVIAALGAAAVVLIGGAILVATVNKRSQS